MTFDTPCSPAEPKRAGAARERVLELCWHELGAALRSLLQSPRYALPALLSLALGIGSATAVFSVFSALVLRPLPFAREQQLVRIGTAREGGHDDPERASAPFARDCRALTDVFEAVTIYRNLPGRIDAAEGAHEFSLTVTNSNFFDTLGVQPEAGRTYTARGAAPDAGDVVVMRHGFWLEAFGGAPIIGQAVRLNDEVKTVIGILPDGQAMPTWADVWAPADALVETGARLGPGGQAVGRIVGGFSLPQAQQRFDALAAAAQHRDTSGALIGVQLTSLRNSLIGARHSSLALLLAAMVAFLLLACANLATLLGTRAAVRQREFALRAALGASRRGLLRQSAFEALLLVLLGGALGLALALPCIGVAARDYSELLGNSPPRLDTRVLAGFAVLLALTTLAGSLAPALQARRLQAMDVLRGEGRSSQSRSSRRLREALLAVQVAAALALLINAGLLIRSVRALLAVDPGFQLDAGVVALVVTPTMRRPPGEAGYFEQMADARRRIAPLYDRLQMLPGAQSTCLATELPFDRMTDVALLEGDVTPPVPPRIAQRHQVSPSCFRTLGIGVLSGRDFTLHDTVEYDQLIVNRSFARQVLQTDDAVGRRLRFAAPSAYTGPPAPWIEIVGMVTDVLEQNVTDTPSPAVYFPFLADPIRQANESSMAFAVVVKPAGAPTPFLTSLPRFLREALPGAAVHGVELTRARMDTLLAERSALERVLTLFALSALVLAAIGLFGVTGYTVAGRSAELGIRRALGASRGRILWLVLSETGSVVALGVAAGLLLTWLGRGFLEKFLFQTGAADPLTYLSVCLGIFAVALLAALVPALDAARISPSQALAER